MSRIIDHTQIAIIYETITGQCQKRVVLTTDTTEDIDAWIARHPPGLQAIIVNRSRLPGPDQNEHFFRQVIAEATGAPYFSYGADRAVMVHPSGHVISVWHGNVPGLDHPDPGHRLVSHQHAEIGDVLP